MFIAFWMFLSGLMFAVPVLIEIVQEQREKGRQRKIKRNSIYFEFDEKKRRSHRAATAM